MNRILCLLLLFIHLLPADVKSTVNTFGMVEADIEYSSGHLQKNSLDLYIPFGNSFPVVLFIHGGSFVSGDRKDFPYVQIGENFQRNGIACAVMSYRLSTDSSWPAQPRDVAKAFRWLKENIAQYGGDSSRIYIVGHSAGGHLAALVCSDPTYLAELGMRLSDVKGCISMGAMMSDAGSLSLLTKDKERELFRKDWFFKIFGTKDHFVNSLPLRHVNASMPKMLIMLADEELFDPPKERTVMEFMDAASKKDVYVSYEVLPNRSHMGTVERMTEPSDPTLQKIIAFIRP